MISIPGWRLVEDGIPPEMERDLVRAIDREPWLDCLKRRVQHYGYHYDYKRRGVLRLQRRGDLPRWSAVLEAWNSGEKERSGRRQTYPARPQDLGHLAIGPGGPRRRVAGAGRRGNPSRGVDSDFWRLRG